MSSKNTQKKANSQGETDLFSGIFPVNKERGLTLATLLDNFKSENNLSYKEKLTYAGRLDPMAEGLVLILAGQSRFQKDSMLGMDKVYEVDVMIGVGTDTLDPLGLITETKFNFFEKHLIEEKLNEILLIDKLPYPLYSSVPVEGKALFLHARNGQNVEVPIKKVKVYEIKLLNIEKVPLGFLVNEIKHSINKVQGDFRQKEIIKIWNDLLSANTDQEVQIIKLKIKASSGTYMRSLAKVLGEKLGSPSLAYRIKRTEIGEYRL